MEGEGERRGGRRRGREMEEKGGKEERGGEREKILT